MLDAFFSEFFFFTTGRQLWLLYSLFQNKNLQNRSTGSGAGILPGTFGSLADSFIA